jgi:hypothetical protein
VVGGFVVAGQRVVSGQTAEVWAISAPIARSISAVAFVPPTGVSTEAARGLLPEQVPHAVAAANSGRAAVLVAAVEDLAPDYRDVVVRRWFDGQKPQRMAEDLDVPLATVKTRLRRALAQLRARLRREWGDGVAGMLRHSCGLASVGAWRRRAQRRE